MSAADGRLAALAELGHRIGAATGVEEVVDLGAGELVAVKAVEDPAEVLAAVEEDPADDRVEPGQVGDPGASGRVATSQTAVSAPPAGVRNSRPSTFSNPGRLSLTPGVAAQPGWQLSTCTSPPRSRSFQASASTTCIRLVRA